MKVYIVFRDKYKPSSDDPFDWRTEFDQSIIERIFSDEMKAIKYRGELHKKRDHYNDFRLECYHVVEN